MWGWYRDKRPLYLPMRIGSKHDLRESIFSIKVRGGVTLYCDSYEVTQ